MKVGRFRIKERITLDLMGQCDAALQAAKQARAEADALVHLKKIVRLLCTKWSSFFVFKRDLRRVDKILEAAGFNSEKSETEYDPNWLINLTSWLGVHLPGRLAHEVAIGSTAAEAAQQTKDIAKKQINDAIRSWRIQHDPEDILKDLNKDLLKLTDNEEEEQQLMQPKISPIRTMGHLLRNSYRA